MIRGRFSITIIVLICTTPCFVRAQIPKPDGVSEDAWKEISQRVPDADRDAYYIYKLHNQLPAATVAVVNLLVNGTAGIGRGPPPPVNRSVAPNTPEIIPFITPTIPAAAKIGGVVAVVADPANNSVLIATDPHNWNSVKAILDDLDRPRQQILVKALIAEVTHDDSPQAAAFFSALDRQALFPQSGKSQTSSAPSSVPYSGTWSISAINSEVTSSLQRMSDNGKVEVLSRPYVLATADMQFVINLGQAEKGAVSNDPGDVSLLFEITPHMATNGEIVFDVAGDMRRRSDYALTIDELNRQITSSGWSVWEFAIESGHPVCLHGMIHEHETTTIGKIPILGDLPLLGALFTGTKTTKANVEVVVMITPRLAIRKQP